MKIVDAGVGACQGLTCDPRDPLYMGKVGSILDITRPQLGPFFVLKFMRSQALGRDSSTISKVLSDRKVLFKHQSGR